MRDDAPRRGPSLAASVTALGVAQIVSWGTLFYTIAVLGAAMRAATGVSEIVMYGAYSAGLALSGLLAPWVGRSVDRHGGRVVLSAGSLAAALACALLASVQGPASLALAWLAAGAAMSATLYDPAFATLHHLAGTSYRRAVTALTLFGGFASTVFWPLSQALLDAWGFRVAFAAYALLNVAVCLPLHVAFVPRHALQDVDGHGEPPAARTPVPRAYAWLALALTGASFASSALSAHMIEVLTVRGLAAGEAVLVGALIGPMQVAGRVAEFALGRVIRPIVAGTLAFAALAASLALLTQVRGAFAAALVFAVLYGASNGVMTIVRGIVPAELFGRRDYGALLGRLALPQFIARAAAPAAFALLVALDPSRGVGLAALAACAAVAWLAYQRAVARR